MFDSIVAVSPRPRSLYMLSATLRRVITVFMLLNVRVPDNPEDEDEESQGAVALNVCHLPSSAFSGLREVDKGEEEAKFPVYCAKLASHADILRGSSRVPARGG